MNYNEFQNKYLGKKVDADSAYGYQCTDLIRIYLNEVFGLPNIAYGNAINYWNNPHPNILKKFSKISSKTPKQGDIIILNQAMPYGHIAIAQSAAKMLEQNGGKGGGTGTGTDAIRIGTIPKNKIIGILRAKELTMQKYKVVFNDGKKKTTKELTPEAMKKSLERYYTDYAVYKRALGSVRVQLERLK